MKLSIVPGGKESITCSAHGDIYSGGDLMSCIIGHAWCKKSDVIVEVTSTTAEAMLGSEALALLPWAVTQSLREIVSTES